MKNIKLTIEQAKDLYKTNPEYRDTLLSVFTDKELELDNFPYKLKKVGGYYIETYSEIRYMSNDNLTPANLNVNVSELDCKSYLAECQLRQIAKICNGGTEEEWINWEDEQQSKYNSFYGNETKKISIDVQYFYNRKSIYFKNKSDLEKSIEVHKDLWLQYFKVTK